MKKIITSFLMLAIISLSNLVWAQIPTNGLVGWWPFNNNANDSSICGNNGSVNGPSLTTDRCGNANRAYSFNGSSDYILVNNSSCFPQTAISICFWLNRMNLTLPLDYGNYISKEHAFQSYLDAVHSNKIESGLYKGSLGNWSAYLSHYLVPNNSDWLFYTFTFDNTDKIASTYINGVLDTSEIETDPSAIVRISSNPMYIGRNGSAATWYINGKMDDIRIYDRVLTPCEINYIYHENVCNVPQPSASNVNICGNGTATIIASGGTNYNWYNTPTGCNIIGTGSPFITPFLTATDTFYVSNLSGTCESGRTMVIVNVLPLPTVTLGNFSSVCLNTTPFTLTGGNPSGGTYSGPGVSGGIFNPANAGVGTHTITYTYTNGNNCTNTATNTITVNALPTVTLGNFSSVCLSTPPFTLTGGNPAGGTYSGPGVSGGVFNPATAGVGTHTITYTYSTGGCTNSATNTITVNALPVVSIIGLGSDYCQNNGPVTLTGNPSGGTFSGNGITGNTFTPGNAIIGNNVIYYSYTDPVTGCSNSTSQNVAVHAIPSVSFSGLNPVFSQSDPPSVLTGTPPGGTFSGAGIIGNTFYPSIAGLGAHTIVYIYTDGYGCMNATCQTTDVVTSVRSYDTEGSNILIYPNPTSGVFNIGLTMEKSENSTIQVFNNLGDLVFNENLILSAGAQTKTIDLSKMANGVYIVNIKAGNSFASEKVTIQK